MHLQPVLRVAATLLLASQFTTAEMPLDELVRLVGEADAARATALHSYSSTRRYRVVSKRFNKTSEVVAHMRYTQPSSKEFTVVSETGPGFLRKRVVRRMLDAEKEAAAQRDKTRMTGANYTFTMVGPGDYEGRPCWIVEVTPKTPNKFLVHGKAWIDQEDFAVVKFEGSPAKNPSFWIKDTRMVHLYAKHGSFWLPKSNHTRTGVRIFGDTDITIEYFDYKVEGGSVSTRAASLTP